MGRTSTKTSAEQKTPVKVKRTQSHLHKTTREVILRMKAGQISDQIKSFYDNIKSFDPSFEIKDPTRMSRLQQLQEYNRLTQYINDHGTKQPGTTGNTDDSK